MLLIALYIRFAVAQKPADLNSDRRLDKHVTYQAPAAAAKAAIAGLGRATNLPLSAGGSIQPDVLLLRLDDVSIREAMIRLSRVVAATWILDHGTYYLTRTDADEAKREAVAHAQLVASLKKALAKQSQALAAQGPFDAATAKALAKQFKGFLDPKGNPEAGPPTRGRGANLPEMQRQTPSGRFAARVFAQLDPETLAQAPPHRRTVFSTNPTRMEMPLHLELGGALEGFVAEQNLYAGEFESYSAVDRMRFEMVPFGFSYTRSFKEAPAKLNIVVKRLDSNGLEGVTLELQVYDASDRLTAGGTVLIPTDPDEPAPRELLADPNEKKLTISPDDMTVMQVMGASFGRPSAKSALPDPIRRVLMRPDLHEPLATFTSSLLLAAAETRHLNVVADLPDAYLTLGFSPEISGGPTANSIIKLCLSLPPSIGPSSVDDKWLEIAGGQARRGAMMTHRANREELGHLFTACPEGPLTIEALARYATVGGGTMDDLMFMVLSSVLYPGIEKYGADEWFTLRLIGALMHRHADAPLKSERISFSSLDPETLALLENIVFFQSPHGISSKIGDGGFVGSQDPCEQMPDGLPRDGTIEVSVTQETAVYSSGASPGVVRPNDLAFFTAAREHPERFQGINPRYTAADKFRLGGIRRFNIQLDLAKDVEFSMSIDEKHLPTGEAVPFEQLPQTFRDDYKRQYDSFNRSGG